MFAGTRSLRFPVFSKFEVAIRSLVAVFLVSAIGASLSAQALKVGYVEIKCEPGVAVFLNDEFKGTTSEAMGGFILQNIATGNHELRVVKEGFNPQSATIPVEAGKVYTFRVNPFTPQLQIKQSGSSGERNVIQKTGTLLIQTLPTDCTISVGDILEETQKTSDEFSVSNFPIGKHKAVFVALGKTVEANFEITSEQRTHIFVNLLNGKIEDRSLRINESKEAEKAVSINSDTYADLPEAEIIEEKSQEEILAEAKAGLTEVQSELLEVDKAIAEGVGGLDEVSKLVRKRTELLAKEAFSKVLVEDAEAVLLDEKKKEFLSDKSNFDSINGSDVVPENVKAAAWSELVEKWDLSVGDTPVDLFWNEDRPDVAFGNLQLRRIGDWPETAGNPSLFIDGNEHEFSIEKPIQELAAGSREIRLEHSILEPFESVVSIKRDDTVVLNWEPEFLSAKVKLNVLGAVENWAARIGEEIVSAVVGDTFEIPPFSDVDLVVYSFGYAPYFGNVNVAYGKTDTIDIELEKLPFVEPSQLDALTVDFGGDLGMTLLPVPSGTFVMGAAPGERGQQVDEGPLTVVTLSQGYWLGETEVTQAHWEALGMRNRSSFKASDRPVETISRKDALEFCERLNEREFAAGRLPEGFLYTLPTEAQWEFACRAGTAERVLPDGWHKGNSESKTHRIGERRPNEWGFYDMLGNVSEWCLDKYEEYYPGGEIIDPEGAEFGVEYVFRGGSWNDDVRDCRASAREAKDAGYRDSGLGFRVCLSSRGW